jgi:DNA-binding transcriptional ArsR family regulator
MVGACRESGLTTPNVNHKLAVLRAATLVEGARDGRHRLYRLDPTPLRDLYDWAGLFTVFWAERVVKLRRHLERKRATRHLDGG